MDNICVFCGSNLGKLAEFEQQLKQLATYLVEHKKTLVYGGGRLGLMGALYQDVVTAGGKVIGVIPEVLEKHAVVADKNTSLIHVKDMSERKQKFVDLADVFVVFPGGLGTMEEFFQVYSWAQLGLVTKPIVLVNIGGYYDKLLAFLKDSVKQGFMPQANLDALIVVEEVTAGLAAAKNFEYHQANKWQDVSQR